MIVHISDQQMKDFPYKAGNQFVSLYGLRGGLGSQSSLRSERVVNRRKMLIVGSPAGHRDAGWSRGLSWWLPEWAGWSLGSTFLPVTSPGILISLTWEGVPWDGARQRQRREKGWGDENRTMTCYVFAPIPHEDVAMMCSKRAWIKKKYTKKVQTKSPYTVSKPQASEYCHHPAILHFSTTVLTELRQF